MNDWQKQAQETRNELQKLVHAIAQHLGDWKTGTDAHDRDELTSSTHEGAKLYINFVNGGLRDRVVIRGGMNIARNRGYETVYDPDTHERLHTPEITVAVSRGVETIAKEIRRRVIPGYLRIFQLGKAQVEQHNDHVSRTQANLTRLATITRDHIDFAKEPERQMYSFYESQGPTGEVHVSGDSVRLERLSLTMQQAEFILQYLYDQHDQKTKAGNAR